MDTIIISSNIFWVIYFVLLLEEIFENLLNTEWEVSYFRKIRESNIELKIEPLVTCHEISDFSCL